MRKRITFTLLILSLIFSNFGFDTVAAKKKDNEETIIDNVEYTVVQDENGDNLLQLKYLDTGKVEFVKTVVEDDVYTNVVVSSEGEVLNKVEY
ncbi:hypothetical protein [Mesobacillus subterraneus]|uniref:hypothetical protein n=2 Tax=Mesobacillus TaxID=2675231 RepID=UPI001CFF1DD1|nr:hypothetical protein [Mesobacillus subterraneus]